MKGTYQAFPIVMGYFAIGIPFGILAVKGGLSLWAAIALSLCVYAGSAQFVALQLLASAAGFFPIYVATFLLNLRHFLMATSLGSALPNMRTPFLTLFAHLITDESYAINIGKVKLDEYLNPWNALGTSVTAFLTWNIATGIGYLAGSQIRVDFKYIEGALPVMFIALLGLQLKERKHWIFSGFSSLLTFLFMLLLPSKWPFLLTAILIPSAIVFYEQRKVQ
ncbi:MAG: AzlC family ABC transporter permease [Deltaproteobacteria bacterium]|nr:AzlC family ABC transporter permease [Deltaproteobacteria bacterium]